MNRARNGEQRIMKTLNEEVIAIDSNEESICAKLVKIWDSPIVLRGQVNRFSGGLLNPRTLANLDSLGKGPKKRIFYNNRVAYPTEVLASWLEERIRERNN